MCANIEFLLLTADSFLSRCKLPKILTRPRRYLSIENIDKNLVESIKYIGIICPIIVDRDYYIVDGIKRYVVIRYLKSNNVSIKEPIPVIRLLEESFDDKPISILHLAYIINKFRAPPSDEEFSEELLTYMQDIAYKVWEVLNKDYEKAARHLGFSVDLVKRLVEDYVRSLTSNG